MRRRLSPSTDPALTAPRAARYTLHTVFRPAAEWAQRRGWADVAHEPAWYAFVERASPRQLALFGFPPPEHPFWTPDTTGATALRYPSRGHPSPGGTRGEDAG